MVGQRGTEERLGDSETAPSTRDVGWDTHPLVRSPPPPPPPPLQPKNAVLLNAVNSTKTAFQKTFGPVVVSEIRNKTVLVNEAKAALNSTKAAIQSAVAPVLVPKIGDKYNDIIAVRNAGGGGDVM